MLSSHLLTFLRMNSKLLSQQSAQVPSEHRPDRGLCGAAERGRLPHQARKIGDIAIYTGFTDLVNIEN